ncbi:efflux RND transporter periplasmic adaptor subunit [Shewanella woodyi]|uniref:Secretion protein HlyD family protein n=1 Tax=Shewanella woodyi (strain ATCC 51908 / MS32) TaxID=392500 RepID=B1KPN2_SHEWM|nr:efflux RND transporter periplasmic adaptor subunit [Shewanella woodyi]ACA86185.1 secretion protein HlyD family protein [Shewanella woodyi ATCC 51908]
MKKTVNSIARKTWIKSFVLSSLTLSSASMLSACNHESVTRVEQGVLSQSIEASGELVSADTVSLMPPSIRRVWQYQVKQLAQEGAEVQQGDMVAQLDTSALTQKLSVKTAKLEATLQDIETSKLRNAKKLEELRLGLAEDKMNLEKAERKFRLSDETVAAIEKFKYQKDAEIARDKVNLTEQKLVLEVKGAKQREAMLMGDRQKFAAEVEQLKRGIQSLTLIAPRSGMVVYCNDSQGNKIKEGQSVFMGDAVLSIPDLTHMQVNMTIPEVEARRVKIGQELKIRLDANPDKVFTGNIIELGAVFRNKNQEVPLVVFDAVASIDEADTELMRPGMTAKISIDIANEKQELLLSLDAVHYDAGQAYVFTPDTFSNSKQAVTIGAIGKERVSITSGLALGQEVVLP